MAMSGLAACAVISACLLSVGTLHAQMSDDSSGGLSRSMRMGIQMFEQGDDAAAMDRFMEVLTNGDAAERPLANEYINLITRRMNSGEKLDSKKPALSDQKAAGMPAAPAALKPPAAAKEPVIASAAVPANREIVVESADAPIVAAAAPPPVKAAAVIASPAAPVTPPVAAATVPPVAPVRALPSREMPRANKALMGKEIRAKIKALKEKSLKQLKGIDGVRILMSETGDPAAIGFPSSLLFQSGVSFQKTAGATLDALTALIFSLSGAELIILPEGTAVGDARVLDMRRTMGISAQLFSAGIAPPRVKVNLLNTQVDIPRAFQDFKGIILLFNYNQPLGLVVESSVGDESGPPLSLGAFPEVLRPEKGEGVIIEFSVQDPPAGLVSWEFKLLAPAGPDGAELAPLQEVVGGGPVYHQIYWNGRQNFFGDAMASGRYECVLTATDAKNRQRTLHRWIHLIGPAVSEALPTAPAQEAAQAASVSKAPAAELPQDGAKAATLVKAPEEDAPAPVKKTRKARPKKKHKPVRKPAKTAAADDGAAEAQASPPAKQSEPAEAHAKPGATPYELQFIKDKHEMTPEAEKTLAQVAETIAYYPLENLDLVGYAHNGEQDAASLAQKRAQMVAGLLINKYKVDPKKIQVHSSVSDTPTYKVEVRFVGGE